MRYHENAQRFFFLLTVLILHSLFKYRRFVVFEYDSGTVELSAHVHCWMKSSLLPESKHVIREGDILSVDASSLVGRPSQSVIGGYLCTRMLPGRRCCGILFFFVSLPIQWCCRVEATHTVVSFWAVHQFIFVFLANMFEGSSESLMSTFCRIPTWCQEKSCVLHTSSWCSEISQGILPANNRFAWQDKFFRNPFALSTFFAHFNGF